MAEHFSNRQSLVDAATVLAARRAIDKEIAHLVADPFDLEAADRLQHVVGDNAARARAALRRLNRTAAETREPWALDAAPDMSSGTGPDDEVAPLRPGPYRSINGEEA